jgi:hypothetical protein
MMRLIIGIIGIILIFIISRNLSVFFRNSKNIKEGLVDISNNIDTNCIIKDICTPCDTSYNTRTCTRTWMSKHGDPGCLINGKNETTTVYTGISCNNNEIINIDNPIIQTAESVKDTYDFDPLTPDKFINIISTANNEINAVIHNQDIYNTMNSFANKMSTKLSDDLQQYISSVKKSDQKFITPNAFQAPALILRKDKPDMIAYQNKNPNGGGNTLGNPFLMDTNYTDKNITNYPISSEYQMSNNSVSPYQSAWTFE